MNRKYFLKQIGVLSAGAFMLPTIGKSVQASGPFFPLRNNAGYFSGRGGTIGWFAKGDALVAIDSQFENSATEFIEGIRDYGNGLERVLFNTHHHGDHVGGNRVFKKQNFAIVAHENVPELQNKAGNPDSVTAEVTFKSEHSVEVENETIRARYYGNAHTNGDAVIWFENANVAHMGDLVFNRVYPFIDRDGDASIKGWISLLETVVEQADNETIFIFGHSNPDFSVTGTARDLLYQRDYLSQLLEHTQSGITAGRSADEIAAISEFEAFSNHISFGERLSLRTNILTAYAELTDS